MKLPIMIFRLKSYQIILHNMETQNIKSNTTDSDLNIKEIDTAGVMKAIKGLKNGKSAAGDDITNEMLKHGSYFFINALKKIFNHILMMVTSHHPGMKVI